MLLNRSASLLYLHKLSPPPTKFFSHFKHSYSLLLSNPSASPPLLPSCPSFSLPRVSFFCLNPPRQRQARPFATATAAAAEGKGTDTFFADEDVSWASLGVSDKFLGLSIVPASIGPLWFRLLVYQLYFRERMWLWLQRPVVVKKQGYLIPLIDMLCSAHDDSVTTVSDQESILPKDFSSSLPKCAAL